MAQPSEENIISALNKSGYLFEQDVATLLTELDFHVETSWAYLDPDQDKSREIDIRAIKQVAFNKEQKIQVFVELLVECKDSESPFVFLERPKNIRELDHSTPNEYLFPVANYEVKTDGESYNLLHPFIHLGLKDKHYYYRENKKATQFSKIVRKGSDWVANHDGIYDSLILPQAKLLECRKNDVKKYLRNGGNNAIWLFFPIVVLRDFLYTYDISTNNGRNLHKSGRVSFVRNIESGSLKGFYLNDFVIYEYLRTYINEEVLLFAEAVSEIVKNSPDIILNNKLKLHSC